MKENNLLLIARILKPHGFKGELKAALYTDSKASLKNVKEVLIDGAPYEVESIKGTAGLIRLKGVDSEEKAEALRNKELYADGKNRPIIPKDAYFIADLLGAEIVSDTSVIGKLTDILQYGSADIYCVFGEKNFMFPAIENVIKNIDAENKVITVDVSELEKVAVYED